MPGRGAKLTARAGAITVTGPQALLVSNNADHTSDIAGLGHRARLDTGALGVVAVTVNGAIRIVILVLLIAAVVVAFVLVRQHRRTRPRPGVAESAPGPADGGMGSSGDSPRSAVAGDGSPGDEGRTGKEPTPSAGSAPARVRRSGTAERANTISARGLTKHYGDKLALDGLSFDVQPGHVTGFLGPNGAGKSTTMRLIMGLDAPDAGDVTVNGRHFRELGWPLREVGALLEAKAVHPGRSAYSHLLMLAQTNRLPRRRVDEVLDLVGLTAVAQQLAGSFSLGMGQRRAATASPACSYRSGQSSNQCARRSGRCSSPRSSASGLVPS